MRQTIARRCVTHEYSAAIITVSSQSASIRNEAVQETSLMEKRYRFFASRPLNYETRIVGTRTKTRIRCFAGRGYEREI